MQHSAEQETSKEERRKKRQEEDRRAKSRGARTTTSGGGSSSQRRSDRDAKEKARGRRNRNDPPVNPGVVAEKNSSDARQKGRARRTGSGPVVPGAVSETKNKEDDARERSKKRKEKNSQNSSSRSTGGSNTAQRERNRKIKEKAAMAAVTPSAATLDQKKTTSAAEDEEIIPMAAAIDIEDEPAKQEEYAVDGTCCMAPAMSATLFASNEAAESARDQEQADEKLAATPTPFYCKAWFWLIVLLVLVGGAVGLVFGLNSSSNDTASSAASISTTTAPTNSPDKGLPPTNVPASTNAPTGTDSPDTGNSAGVPASPSDAPTSVSQPTDPTEPTDSKTPPSIPPPSMSPSSNPTDAPVVGPSPPPTVFPTATPSVTPTGLPPAEPSSNPTFAPFPGPSPPPTPSPSKVPTVSPTPSPTKMPSQSPSSRPTTTPSLRPTRAPSQQPSKGPTQQPSVVPTVAPTDRPTFAFDGQGVPVYGDWENEVNIGDDIGQYFLYVPNDWEAVFGSLPPAYPASAVLNAEQRRNDQVIWQGQMIAWTHGGSRSDIPVGFESGRRNPYSNSAIGQWETGDVIVPRYVTPNVDWRSSFNANSLSGQGKYFLYKYEEWEATFGFDPRSADAQTPAIVCRNGQQVYSADIQTWPLQTYHGGYLHARRVSGSTTGDFEQGDYLLPPNMACPKAIRSSFTSPVPITAADATKYKTTSVAAGSYFFFDNSDWEQAFEFPTFGDCATSCSVSTRDINLAFFNVRQCRNGAEIWTGLVATSASHFYYPSESRAVGRRNNPTAGDFETGDTIVPFSRSCS
ncbi:unnamed protein product [Cylindrotheca closterium]|uniref:Transmembrane protein n=1 Tax=Cylindrotheca closterium TaxID=2856 RepID=A0AAD2CSU1_9STRA|nr:unnamed protein product [Cylindrotheca closterium]